MCRGIAFSAAPVLDLDGPEDFNWFDAIDELDEDDEFGFEPPEPQSETSAQSNNAEANGSTGMDLLDWFSKQLNSEMMVAPNGVVLPTAPLMPAAAPEDLDTSCTPPVQQQQQLPMPPAGMAASSSYTSCYQQPSDLPSPVELPAENLQQLAQRVVVIKERIRVSRPCSTRPYSSLNELSEEDRIERVKQKRRESAQRSRARKNAYVKELEAENSALKQQVLQLKAVVGRMQSYMTIN